MTPAVAAILEGMPEPSDLRLHRAGGRHVIMVGSRVLFDYDAADAAMRNLALATLRRLGFPGRRVAEVLGLTENYVATLYRAAMRQGSAALTGPGRRGAPGKLTDADWARAAAWRAEDVPGAEIGRRLGGAHTTVARRLGPRARPRRRAAPPARPRVSQPNSGTPAAPGAPAVSR